MNKSTNRDKFFNNLVSENYSDAHKFLGEIINENVASKISKELTSTINEGIFDRIKARAKGAFEQGKTYGKNIKGAVSNVGKGVGRLARGEEVSSDDLYQKQDPMLQRGKAEASSIAGSIEKDVQDFLTRAKEKGTLNEFDLDAITSLKDQLIKSLQTVNPEFNKKAYETFVNIMKTKQSEGKDTSKVYKAMLNNFKYNKYPKELEKAFKDVSASTPPPLPKKNP